MFYPTAVLAIQYPVKLTYQHGSAIPDTFSRLPPPARQDAAYSDPVSPVSRQPVRHLFKGALKHVLIQVGLSLFRLIYLQIFVHILHKQERFVAGLYSGHLLIPLHSQSAR